MWLAVFLFFSGICLGVCASPFLRGRERLDTEKIKRLAEISQKSNYWHVTAYAPHPGQKQQLHVPAAEFRDLVATLAPITGARIGVMRFPEYEFSFQTRMDPTMIYVRFVAPTILEFEINGVLYVGGDGLEFKRRIDGISASSPVNPRDPTPNAASESN